MPRNFKLTWQPGRDGRTGRWRKKYKGMRYYFPGGAGSTTAKPTKPPWTPGMF